MNITIKEISVDTISTIAEYSRELNNEWTYSMIEDVYNNSNYLILGLFIDNQLLGYSILLVSFDFIEIIQIYVKEKGEGYGSLLLEQILNIAGNKQAQSIYLEVSEMNIRAISFYNKHHFNQISIRKNYYGDESAIVMERKI